jgi:hypothetical protein
VSESEEERRKKVIRALMKLGQVQSKGNEILEQVSPDGWYLPETIEELNHLLFAKYLYDTGRIGI